MKNRRVLIAVIALLIAALAFGGGYTVYSGAPAQRIARQMTLGEQYLSELNYESAITAFTEAFSIDPFDEEAKNRLIETYHLWVEEVAVNEGYESAIKLLDEAREQQPSLLELENQEVGMYLRWTEELIRQYEYESAINILSSGVTKLADDRLSSKLAEINEQWSMVRLSDFELSDLLGKKIDVVKETIKKTPETYDTDYYEGNGRCTYSIFKKGIENQMNLVVWLYASDTKQIQDILLVGSAGYTLYDCVPTDTLESIGDKLVSKGWLNKGNEKKKQQHKKYEDGTYISYITTADCYYYVKGAERIEIMVDNDKGTEFDKKISLSKIW